MKSINSFALHSHPLFRPNTVLLMTGLSAIAVLLTAYIFQWNGYAPCKLCWWQRYPYMVIPFVCVGAAFLKEPLKAKSLFLIALLFLTTSSIGAFHAGVEYGWWAGPDTCSGTPDLSGGIDQALEAILSAQIVRCDAVSWSLFGISMAGYNFLIALDMALYSLIAGTLALKPNRS